MRPIFALALALRVAAASQCQAPANNNELKTCVSDYYTAKNNASAAWTGAPIESWNVSG